MTLRAWPIDVLPDATALTTSNLKATDATAAALVSAGTGNTVRSSTTHIHAGTSSMLITTGTSASAAVRLPMASHTQGAASFYLWLDAFPTATYHFIALKDSSGTMIARFGINTSGKLIQSTNTSTGSALTLSQWNRIEAVYNIGTSTTTGSLTLNAYNGDATGSPYTSLTVSGGNLGGTGSNTIAIAEFGTQSAVAVTQYVDSIQLNDGATALLGPYIPANNPPVVSVTGNQDVTPSTAVTATATASDTDGTIASYAWTVAYSSTTAPTLTGASTATVGFTTDASTAGELVILQCVVTDNGGATTTVTTEVRTPTAGGTVGYLPTNGTGATWTNTGGAATEGAALNDSSDTTYIESPVYTGTPSVHRFRFRPMTPGSAASLLSHTMVTATGGTTLVRLVEGPTNIVRQQFTLTQNTSFADETDTITTPGAITDWGYLSHEFSVST